MTSEPQTPEPGASPPEPLPEPPARVSFTEGSLTLPAQFEDRSTNVFVPPDPQSQPNLSVARDWLHEGELLEAYVDRQLALLSRLPGHKLLGRAAERLGPAEGETEAQDDRVLHGERVEAQYRSGPQTIRQRQAVFLVAPRRALIFTASSPRPFDETTEALWHDWLGSFVPAAVLPATNDDTPPTAPDSPAAQ